MVPPKISVPEPSLFTLPVPLMTPKTDNVVAAATSKSRAVAGDKMPSPTLIVLLVLPL